MRCMHCVWDTTARADVSTTKHHRSFISRVNRASSVETSGERVELLGKLPELVRNGNGVKGPPPIQSFLPEDNDVENCSNRTAESVAEPRNVLDP